MKLSKAQQHIVNVINYDGSCIQATITSCGCEGNYLLAKRGVLTKIEGQLYSQAPYHMAQTTIKCLIHKKVLIPTLSNKEFAIQFALGTMDYRIYELAEAYK
ncbi:hypothetical protein LCGC14_2038840 [marine sediment metagenome]|uniref:Uncharacterized protein n=1 Tax=marine sediment metagenome TaxID=412755 RepID=A0A0F9HPJ4_9ZZZZ